MRALPALPFEQWEPTKETLHLWAQIVGKVRLAATPPQNHWWNAPLYVDTRGLTTRRLRSERSDFDVSFDFVAHELVVRTSRGETNSFPLAEGLSVAAFYERLFALLTGLGIEVETKAEPFGIPVTTPFAEDTEHAFYDREVVARFSEALRWIDWTLQEFAGWFCGKTSPVHLFWHGFDLAVTRFSGERAAENPNADRVSREAYSHEVISFGFWPGDRKVRMPAFYSYTAPEPAGLAERPLRPQTASWQQPFGSSHLALLPYDDVRTSSDPRETLLDFLESAYDAGATLAGWDREGLRSSWCPTPVAREDLPGGGR
ncbi:MAG: DUF5996 family protein [Gaiellaceae bacterium]